jgi:hypothetical protein
MSIGTPTAIITGTTGASNWPNAGASAGFPITANIVAGNLLVAVLAFNALGASTVTSMSDGTNAYGKAVSLAIGGPTDIEIWYCANAKAVSAGATLTVNLSTGMGNQSGNIGAFQVSGANTVDATSSGSAGATTSISLSTAALAQPNEIVFGTALNIASGAYQTPSWWTNIYSSGAGGFNFAMDYKIVAPQTAVTYVPTWASSGLRIAALVATFVPALTGRPLRRITYRRT